MCLHVEIFLVIATAPTRGVKILTKSYTTSLQPIYCMPCCTAVHFSQWLFHISLFCYFLLPSFLAIRNFHLVSWPFNWLPARSVGWLFIEAVGWMYISISAGDANFYTPVFIFLHCSGKYIHFCISTWKIVESHTWQKRLLTALVW